MRGIWLLVTEIVTLPHFSEMYLAEVRSLQPMYSVWSKVANWFSHSFPGYFFCHWDRLCTTIWQAILKPRMLLRASAMPSM